MLHFVIIFLLKIYKNWLLETPAACVSNKLITNLFNIAIDVNDINRVPSVNERNIDSLTCIDRLTSKNLVIKMKYNTLTEDHPSHNFVLLQFSIGYRV
jgi:hypothetical protein